MYSDKKPVNFGPRFSHATLAIDFFRQTRKKCDGSTNGGEEKKSIIFDLNAYMYRHRPSCKQQSTLTHRTSTASQDTAYHERLAVLQMWSACVRDACCPASRCKLAKERPATQHLHVMPHDARMHHQHDGNEACLSTQHAADDVEAPRTMTSHQRSQCRHGYMYRA